MLRIIVALAVALFVVPARATEAGWVLLRDGEQVVLLRHAMAPGAADPANFDIADCKTQRNLSDRGKQQARKMGALFAARAAPVERIVSSRYCRALDTARIAFEEEPEQDAALDLLSADKAKAEAQTKAVIEMIRAWSGSGNLVLVTHLENIKALTGADAREGEAIIVRAEGDGLRVIGRIVFN